GEERHQRVAPLRRGGLRDVEAERPAALVDRLRPGGGVDAGDAVETGGPEAALADVVADQRLAEAVGRVAAEVARAAEVAVAALDVVDLQLPARDPLLRLLLLLRHRAPPISRACALRRRRRVPGPRDAPRARRRAGPSRDRSAPRGRPSSRRSSRPPPGPRP